LNTDTPHRVHQHGHGDFAWARRYGGRLASLYALETEVEGDDCEIAARIAARCKAERPDDDWDRLAAEIDDIVIL
jgi:hypothetical protein